MNINDRRTADAGDMFGVARELRNAAHREGVPLVRKLHEAYDAINAEHFGGELAPAAILITRTQSPRALGDHIPVDENGIRFRVRISPVVAREGERYALDVLLHELVHLAMSYLEGDREPGYQGHGPKFASWCNRIGAKMGLAEVFARGTRKGLPDCAHWPLCVRPPGYYGFELNPKTPSRPARQRAGEPDDDQDEQGDDGDPNDLALPRAFLQLCKRDGVDPRDVLRRFAEDLAEGETEATSYYRRRALGRGKTARR